MIWHGEDAACECTIMHEFALFCRNSAKRSANRMFYLIAFFTYYAFVALLSGVASSSSYCGRLTIGSVGHISRSLSLAMIAPQVPAIELTSMKRSNGATVIGRRLSRAEQTE